MHVAIIDRPRRLVAGNGSALFCPSLPVPVIIVVLLLRLLLLVERTSGGDGSAAAIAASVFLLNDDAAACNSGIWRCDQVAGDWAWVFPWSGKAGRVKGERGSGSFSDTVGAQTLTSASEMTEPSEDHLLDGWYCGVTRRRYCETGDVRVAAIGHEQLCVLFARGRFKECMQSAVVRGGRLRGTVCCFLPLAGVYVLAARLLEFTLAVGCIGAVATAV